VSGAEGIRTPDPLTASQFSPMTTDDNGYQTVPETCHLLASWRQEVSCSVNPWLSLRAANGDGVVTPGPWSD